MVAHPDAISRMLHQHGPLQAGEQRVLKSIGDGLPVSRHAGEVADEHARFGERLADHVAEVGGSWSFIIGFGLVLLAWMLLNTDVLTHWGLAFDPYPYIFLNLMLSTLAAVQAPVIMMSQNRQAAKDRVTAQLDYEVNLRAELEILRLHDTIDLQVSARFDALEAKIDQIAQRFRSPDLRQGGQVSV